MAMIGRSLKTKSTCYKPTSQLRI